MADDIFYKKGVMPRAVKEPYFVGQEKELEKARRGFGIPSHPVYGG